MPNLRIVSDNAIDRAATLTATSQASTSMSVGNLLIDRKSSVWRSVGTAANFRATWGSAETIGCVALPFCNLSPTATMRVRVTNEAQATNVLLFTQDFTNGVWGKNGTVTADATQAPDGTVTADRLTGGSSDGYVVQTYGVTSGITYTASVWMRADTPVATNIYLYTGGANQAIVNVNVTTSWQRFNITLPATATAAVSFQIGGSGSLANRSVYLWGAQLEVGSVATSYYPGAATRPLGYIDGWQSYAYDSGAVACCPETPIKLRGFTAAQSASAYAYGGGATARVWLAPTQALGLAVDIVDNNNLQGYIEAARFVTGNYWSTTYNPSAVTFGAVDTTTLGRTDAGDQTADVGIVYSKLSMNMSMMPQADHGPLINLLRNSKVYPILVSVFPQQADALLERDTMIYGRRSKDSDVAIQYGFAYSTTLEVESI